MRKICGAVVVLILLALIVGIATITTLTSDNSNTPQTVLPSLSAPSNSPTTPTSSTNVPEYTYSVIQAYPHDPSAFTQGLTFDNDGNLLEGTGLYGNSSLRRVNLVNGQVLHQINLSFAYFGEGIAVVDNQILQLTWQNNTGFIYDKDSFEVLGSFIFNTEGWGLTYDGTHLIMSDGTDTLYFLDPTTFQTVHSINVHDNNGTVEKLNELEYINGSIYANIWFSSKIAIINPTTGQIEAYLNLEPLTQQQTSKDPNSVLNGIAYNSKTNKLYVTGKNWSNIYEIQIA